MGATSKVDSWECDTVPERRISISALVNDHPPPVWRVIIRDYGATRRIKVVALTEEDALARVRKELPGAVIILIEPAS